MLAASRTEALHKSPEGLSAQNVSGSSARVTLTDERPEPSLCHAGSAGNSSFPSRQTCRQRRAGGGGHGCTERPRCSSSTAAIGALPAHVQNLVSVFSPGAPTCWSFFKRFSGLVMIQHNTREDRDCASSSRTLKQNFFFFFLKKMNTFIQQLCIQLIKSNRKDLSHEISILNKLF